MVNNIELEAQLEIPPLKYWANYYSNTDITDEEIQKIDRTKDLYDHEIYCLKNNMLVAETINGPVRGGKSTVALQKSFDIFRLAKKLKVIPQDKTFNMKNVFADQHEYDKSTRDPEIYKTVVMVDEFSEAEETGENITILIALRKQISDVHAGRYIHRIMCAPKQVVDDNTEIILEVVHSDKPNRRTFCWLYYNMLKSGTQYRQLLGFVWVDVSDILEYFINNSVEELYWKPNKSELDEEMLRLHAKNDLYSQYFIRKYEKMNLLTKEKIMRKRELDYAECILQIVDELKPLTKNRGLINDYVIENFVKIKAKELDLPQSLIGSRILTQRISGILHMYESYHQQNKKLNKLMDNKDKIDPMEYESLVSSSEIMRDKILNGVKLMENIQKDLIETKKKYEAL